MKDLLENFGQNIPDAGNSSNNNNLKEPVGFQSKEEDIIKYVIAQQASGFADILKMMQNTISKNKSETKEYAD